MAKFCEQCGAPLSEGVRFCAECGAPVPAAAEAPAASAAPAAPAAAPEAAPQPQAAPAATMPPPAPQPPKEKKPLPKWVIPVVAVVAVLAIGLFATIKILGNLHSPDKAIEHFLDALDEGDLEALTACAACVDEDVALTEGNTAALFRLYAEDSAFRKSVEDQLEDDLELIEDGEDPSEDQLFDLKGEKSFLHTAYTVTIAACSAEITGNLSGEAVLTEDGQRITLTPDDDGSGWAAGWSDMFGPDCDLAHWCTGKARDLLPGLYTVSGTVTTSFGDTFTASADLKVTSTSGAYTELYYECSTLTVYNDNDIDAELYIGGDVYGVLEPHQSYTVAPILPDTQVEVRADVGADEPVTLTSTAEECGGSFNVSFRLCTVEIANHYDAPITVTRDGKTLLELPAGATETVSSLPEGAELTLSLYAGVVDDVTVTCDDTYRFVEPEFYLSDEQLNDIDSLVFNYLQDCIGAFNTNSLTSFDAIQETDFRNELRDSLAEILGYNLEEDGVSMTMQASIPSPPAREPKIEAGTEEGGILTAWVCYTIDFNLITHAVYAAGEPSEQENSTTLDYWFELSYTGGSWQIGEAY